MPLHARESPLRGRCPAANERLVGLAVVPWPPAPNQGHLPADPVGRLFARGLDEISELYIEPVSSRSWPSPGWPVCRGSTRRFRVTESCRARARHAIVLTYDAREVSCLFGPSGDDPHAWGDLGRHAHRRRQGGVAGDRGAAEDTIEKAVLDGMTGGARPLLALCLARCRARPARGARRLRRDRGHSRLARRRVPRHRRHPAAGRPIAPASGREDQIVAVDGVADRGCLHERGHPPAARPGRQPGRGHGSCSPGQVAAARAAAAAGPGLRCRP